MSWSSVVGKAVVSFAATNIDDILVLTLFFAQKNMSRWRVVAGQYLGLGAVIAISMAGFFARLIIPAAWIGFLGVAPIAIGLKKIVEWKKTDDREADPKPVVASIPAVAAVTFANGGDNIAVYVPLFARSDGPALIATLIIFAIMIALWCAIGYYIGSHPIVSRVVDRFGVIIVPFVLIALGVYIFINAH